MKNKHADILVIGIGPHARRIYIPAVEKLGPAFNNAKIVAGFDIESEKDAIDQFIEKRKSAIKVHYIPHFDPKNGMPESVATLLDTVLKEYSINAVIISTEPLVHGVYAEWAIKNRLHILMDKPVTARKNVVSDATEAAGIFDDYKQLYDGYARSQKDFPTAFSINAQRRYELGHKKVFELIKEVADKFNAPVTSVQAMHADGQWRLPSEIVTQIYHPYCQGYGKCSHSGYHIFDIVYRYIAAGARHGKMPDELESFSSFVTPTGFIQQFTSEDYVQYFGKEYDDVSKWSDKELQNLYQGYGEMDAFIHQRLLKDGENICNVSINLLHNTFARRTWILPGEDLYKGNGRVKQSSFVIQQGPFQAIHVHNFQATDQHDDKSDGKSDTEMGGKNHFDIHVFRNAGMFNEGEVPYRKISIDDLSSDLLLSGAGLANENAKYVVVAEFLEIVTGKKSPTDSLSHISDHAISARMMSDAYLSHINQTNKSDGLIKSKIRF
jgi:hypothetical protein